MTPFSPDQWVMLVLIFALGLVIGMFFLAGNKWKHRYKEEVRRREELERENETLRRDAREMETLRGAAARHPHRDEDGRGPL